MPAVAACRVNGIKFGRPLKRAIEVKELTVNYTPLNLYQNPHYTGIPSIPESPLYQNPHYTEIPSIPESPLYQNHLYTRIPLSEIPSIPESLLY